MSKQQTFMPEDTPSKKRPRRKRKGKYELWMRLSPNVKRSRSWCIDWHKTRSYETLELAEKNRSDSERKWGPNWEFEVRIKDG